MIYYNSNIINDWNFGDDNIIKVYRHGAVVFYKFDSEQGGYKVCFAVVEDITQYSDREFEDVYDKETEKWFKLNNLNQYEEYGIYGSGRTSCEGSTSRLPVGYTEVEYIENTSTAYINLGISPYNTLGDSFNLESKLSSYTQSNLSSLISCESSTSPYYGCGVRWNGSAIVPFGHNLDIDNPDTTFQQTINVDNTSAFTFHSDNVLYRNDNTPITLFCGLNGSSPWRNSKGKCYSFKLTINNNIVRDLVPCKRDSDNKYGMYDLVTNTFYLSPNNVDFSGGDPITPDCVTTYNGKLTIDDGYEYEWNGSSWVNLGEVSGSSRVPIGYTEIEYIQNTGTSYINTNFKPNQDTRIVCTMQCVTSSQYGRYFGAGDYNAANAMQFDYENGAQGTLHISWGHIASWTTYSSCVGDYNVHTYDWNKNYFYRDKGETNQFSASTTYTAFQCVANLGIFCHIYNNGGVPTSQNEYMVGKMYSFQIYDNGTLVRDFVPCKRDSDSKYGVYDVVNNTFYSSANSTALSGGAETGSTEYPKYYSEKSEPLDNLTFNTLADAQAYAKANCVYDGMHATIGNDRYYFDSTDENGWVKLTEYYVVEDVTSGGASGWTITGSSTYNPDPTYYDDFDLETNWTSYAYKIAKITIYGYDHFTYYLRAYSQYSAQNAYLMASNIDELSSYPTSMSYSSNSAVVNTYDFRRTAGSAVNLSNYRRVTYNNLDKTVEHTFYVYFYGRTYSSYVGNATILIPKEQTNENWEQVTFSASSNVASTQKSLYIDNNNSTSGGTLYWYYRWMVGLPSGSHSSYTNYSNYSYCPNVTSSTFTSVAGEQRQVNFTYDNTTNKTLSFRLTDGSNVLTPSDTVYYNMTYYNSCGVSTSSSNVTFPRSLNVKVGGRFRFANSSNRHYIYGYSPNISLNTDYYVDNYQSTFDITYTKLSEEAVSVTYTTYDPSDSETPSFKTDITYPYSGGTTSSTTLTSYAVPYTYSYTVKQTNNMFSSSTASYTYTAGQASRTITFTLYPNNREFASVADLEAYGYPWEGMIAYVGTDKYVYQNGEWVYNPSRLPAGYTEVEYVQNTGTSYLDIAFKPNTNTRILTEMQAVSSANYPRLFGAGTWNAATGINVDYQTDGGQNCLHINWYGRTSWSYYTSFTFDYDKHTYDLNKNYLYRDETLVGSTSYTTSYQSSDNLGVFTYIASGRPSSSSYWGQEHFKGKMYSFKVYDNGTLVRDLVPCVRDNDNTVGAYDIVNDVFYTVPTGYTTDKLIAGDPV